MRQRHLSIHHIQHRLLAMLALLLVCGHVMAQVEFTKYFEDNKGTLKVTIPTETARLVGWLQHSEEVLQNFNFETIGTDTITPAQACLAFRINPTFFPYSNSMNIDFDIKMESGFSWHNVGKYHFDMGAEEPSKTINDPNNCGVVLHYIKNPYVTPDKRGEEMMNPVIHFYPNGMYMWQRSKDNDSYEQLTIRAVVTFEKLDLGLPFTFEPWTVEIERKYVLKYEDPKSIRIDTKEMGEMILPRYEPQSSAWKDNILHYGNNDHIHMAPDPLLLYGNGDRPEKSYLSKDTTMLPYPQDGNMYSVMTIEDGSGIFFEEDGNTIVLPGYERKIDVPDSLNFARLHQVTSSSSFFDQNSSTVILNWQHDGRSPRKDCKFYVYRFEVGPGQSDPVNRYTKGNWKYLGNKAANSDKGVFDFKDSDGVNYNASYVYAIVTIPGVWLKDASKFNPTVNLNLLPDYCPCTLQEVRTNPQVGFSLPLTQDTNKTDNITLKWQCTKVPSAGQTIQFNIYRRIMGEENWKRLGTVDVKNDGKTQGTYTDKGDLQSCTAYEYKVSTEIKNAANGLDNKWESDVLSASLLERSQVTEVRTSKGDQQNSVLVSWTAKLVGNDDVTYHVDRRLANSNNDDDYVTIHTQIGHATTYQYEDKNAESGQYYQYRVSSYTRNCDSDDDELVFSNSIEQIGFGLNRGSISGNITFGSAGAAVEGVRLVLSTRGDEEQSLGGHAQYVTGVSQGIYWDASSRQTAALMDSEHPFTLQLLVHPSTNCQQAPVVSIPGLGDLTVTKIAGEEAFRLALCGKEFTTTIPAHRYSQLTLCVRKEMATLILDGQTSQPYSLTLDGHTWSAEHPLDGASTHLSLGGRTDLDEAAAFVGELREFRLWTKELTDREIGQTCDRILSGREQDLAIYWPMDEGTQGYVFDFSTRSGVSNHRHATVGANVLVTDRQEQLPAPEQVQIYGITDVNGHYTVRGIPFTGAGVAYTVTPQMELHEFAPASRNGFISNQSLVLNNYDFSDRSSFEYSGSVTYLNTDIPVDSVTFSIDGIPVRRDDKPVMSNRKGEFSINVPIGDHYIEASAAGHKAIRYPATGTYCFTEGGTFKFADSTLVNVAGRINGGVSDAGAPLGFGKSRNRIGPATITLKLETLANNRFNLDANGQPRKEQTPISSMDNRITSVNYYSADDPTKIVIHTNPATGEFSAMLPPLRYVIDNISFGQGSPYNEADCFKNNLPAMDARFMSVQPVDTMHVDGEKVSYETQSRTILNYRSEPEITVRQLFSDIDAAYDAFGEPTFVGAQDKEYPLFTLYTEQEEENDPAHKAGYLNSYSLTYPIFAEGEKYSMLIKVSEKYKYYDADGNPGREFTEVPTDGQVLISNQMSNRNTFRAEDSDSVLVENKGSLIQTRVSEDGVLLYSFVCGKPNFATEDHTKTITFSFNADGKVTLWKGHPNSEDKGMLRAIVLGRMLTGTNFVTKGPDLPLYVLRDPGGAGSSATYAHDTIRVDYEMLGTKTTTKEQYGQSYKVGSKVTYNAAVVVGGNLIGAGVETDFTLHPGWQEEVQKVKSYDEAKTITITDSEKFSTPNDYFHVGRAGDTYIGYSTNIYYGMGRSLKLIEENSKLKLENAEEFVADLNVGETTHFIYPEYDIVNRTIPNWEKMRNKLLEQLDDWSDTLNIKITDGRVHFYTALKPSDPRFGSANDDVTVWGKDELGQNNGRPSYILKYDPTLVNWVDTISLLNSYINNWKNCIAANEDDKINAIEGGHFENITFSGGNTITRTITLGDTIRMAPGTEDYKRLTNVVSFAIKREDDFHFRGLHIEGLFESSHSQNTTQSETHHIESKDQVSYTLADKNKSAGLSINVYQSPRKWGPIFITQGGQTATPWEGPTYCDYSISNRGKPLDQATLKIENADLNVLNPSLNNVPNGDPALFQLELTGMSEVQSPELFTLKLHPEDDLHGAVLSIDGAPLTNTGITWKLFQTTVIKTLKLVQTDLSVLDYNFRIRLESTSDPYNIYTDWITMSAKFIPVSCPAKLTIDKNVINAQSGDLDVTISDINTRYSGLVGVELLHRSVGDVDWTKDCVWVLDALLKSNPNEYPGALSLPSSGKVQMKMKFDSDGTYELMARTFTKYGQQNLYRETDTLRVTQDCQAPRQLGSIEPISGLLTLTNRDDMCVTFNEDINTIAISKAKNFLLQYEDPESLSLVKVADESYDYTASDRQITFSLKDLLLPKLQGRTLHVQLQQIPDLYGNESEKIDWKVACDFRSIAWPFDQDERTLSRNTDYRSVEIPLIPMASNHAYTIDCYLSVNGSWASCPKWLKLEGTSGITRLNDGYPTVRFTISQAAPAGEHYLKFVVKDDNNVTDSLIYKLTVEGEVPQWGVNPNDYDDNMTLVVNLFDGTQQIQDLSTLAAFDQDGNCCGVAQGGLATAYLVIYGNAGEQKQIHFEYFDKQTGLTHSFLQFYYPGEDQAMQTYIPFVAGSMIGTPGNTARLTFGDGYVQHLHLNKGWNWTSLYVEPSEPSVQAIFARYAKEIELIKWHDRFADVAEHVDGEISTCVNGPLATLPMQAGRLYKIKARQDVCVDIYSTNLLATTGLQLTKGWNWMGCAGAQPMALSDLLPDAQMADFIKSNRSFAYRNERGEWEGALEAVMPGVGYCYYANAEAPQAYTYQPAPLRATEIDRAGYSENMTMVVRLTDGGKYLSGYDVEVIIDDTPRAYGTSDSLGLCYLTVLGNDADAELPLTLRIGEGSYVTEPEDLVFMSDAICGTTIMPYLIDLHVDGINSLTDDADAPIVTYDLLGRRIEHTDKMKGFYIVRSKKSLINH